MNSKVKQLIFSFILVAFNHSVFANEAEILPNKTGGFNIGIDALYLKANTDDLEYAVLEHYTDDSITVAYTEKMLCLIPLMIRGFASRLAIGFRVLVTTLT